MNNLADGSKQPENVVTAPLALLAELTHRCPLHCPYCSNPLELAKRSDEMDTDAWVNVLDQAYDLGLVQVHFSGGEPTLRPDLEDLIDHGAKKGLYTNLITSGVLLDADRARRLADVGLEHVQLGFQDAERAGGDWIAGRENAHEDKLKAARMITDAGLALTVNVVCHRHNIHNLPKMIDMAVELGAGRLEVANVQYYGWGLTNRASLMPSLEQLQEMTPIVEEARQRLKGKLVIDYVIPDYYARFPKACMGGWARRFVVIHPSGKVLPCHAAESIPGLEFENIRDRSLGAIWATGQAFEAYRATRWMPEGCENCERKEIDWGGCRCQALALAGDAAKMDPTCQYSPDHEAVRTLAAREAARAETDFAYRGLKAKS